MLNLHIPINNGFLQYYHMLQKYFSDVTFTDISRNGEMSALGFFAVRCVATAREFLLLHF